MSSVYFLELNTHALLTLQLSELPETQHKPLWYATMRCIGQESAESATCETIITARRSHHCDNVAILVFRSHVSFN